MTYEIPIETWHKYAACLGTNPALFYSERGESTKEAKRICAVCVVRTQCRQYAELHGEKYGVWGGESEKQRRRRRSQSKRRPTAQPEFQRAV